MLNVSLDEIAKEHLEALLTEKIGEGRTLDYKRELSLSNDEDKRELARDVSALANAAGGDLIFGIEEEKDPSGANTGIPKTLLGVACPNFDATKLRFESILREVVDPRVPGIAIHKVDGFPNGPIIVLRVPRSWIGPHMVSYKNQTHFYSRNSAGRQPLDVREIRAAFLASDEAGQAARRFRDGRVGLIVADETPVPLSSAVKAVLHIVPLLSGPTALDVVAIEREPSALRPPHVSSSGYGRFNLDGYVAFTAPEKTPQPSYVQAFRHGAIEAVFAGVSLPAREGKGPELFALPLETEIVKSVAGYLATLHKHGFEPPFSIMLTVVGAKGARIEAGGIHRPPWEQDLVIDRDLLVLPDVLVERLPADPAASLRPAFDALWQASGFKRSLGYNSEGAWDHARHRG